MDLAERWKKGTEAPPLPADGSLKLMLLTDLNSDCVDQNVEAYICGNAGWIFYCTQSGIFLNLILLGNQLQERREHNQGRERGKGEASTTTTMKVPERKLQQRR
ncbi:hypothetical protein RND71_026766 [Anisodus tanguticus]|uniref:Uncharacterized protein n=1 Tax=Anisodus tanguticus TaxID=243964 RepID=A0AAE1RPH3_9SOLA|nr:hypothetical protein RND71_026766 [Anisodus tanguticus]